MNTHLVITVLADDRPGIVSLLSDTIKSNGGNWLESRMSRLGGKFAGILRVDVSASGRKALVEALDSLRESGIRISIEEAGVEDQPTSETVSVSLMGNDRAGIVEEISSILSGLRVNVEDLSTSVTSAPMSADELFHATILAGIPAGMSRYDLQRALEGLSDDLTVEITGA